MKKIRPDLISIASRLEKFGLSPYESKAYTALVFHGKGNAETIAKNADIPRTSAYSTLRSLEEKGFVTSIKGRPATYRPEPPSKVQAKLIGEINDIFDRLQTVHEMVAEKGEPQLIYTIAGKKEVIEKIGEVIDSSTKSIVISTPLLNELVDALGKNLKNAKGRNVEIYAITEHGQRIPDCMNKVVFKSGLIATDIVCDDDKALIASIDLDACGYSDNAQLAGHLARFLKLMLD